MRPRAAWSRVGGAGRPHGTLGILKVFRRADASVRETRAEVVWIFRGPALPVARATGTMSGASPFEREVVVSIQRPEAWLRGPIEGVPPLLQPVAHALLQAREEVEVLVSGFPDHLLWSRPAGVASVGFHLRHLTGVVDRLFTYAAGQALSAEQMKALRGEASPDPAESVESLTQRFTARVDQAVEQLRSIDEAGLTAPRSVGRRKLPSTVLGLLFHSAEHTQRHVGQLLVTIRVQQPGAFP